MKNKITNILILTCIITMILSVIITYKLNQKKNDFVIGSNIAIMIYDENIKDYVKHNEVPKGLYILNKEKTECVGRGKIISYNAQEGTIKYDLEAADECYAYFDAINYAYDTIKSLYVSQGVNNLYFHDSSLENSAGDNSYRYSGKNPDNYVCFDDDCTKDNNLYRIIGVFGDYIKLIKYTSISGIAWNTTGRNTWENSTLEKYLNQTWLPTLGEKADLIDMSIWKVGGMSWVQGRAPRAYFDLEKADTVTIERKIGLLYPSEYGYAAGNSYWNTSLYAYSDSAMNTDWLHNSTNQWLISRYADNSNAAFYVGDHGGARGGGTNTGFEVRPCFNLIPSVKIKSGTGTKTDPYIIIP